LADVTEDQEESCGKFQQAFTAADAMIACLKHANTEYEKQFNIIFPLLMEMMKQRKSAPASGLLASPDPSLLLQEHLCQLMA
jgi:hypothetical protein